jgi:hypothetical protein
MLDIPLLIVTGRHVARMARRKNRSPRRYVWMLILAWYGGAFLGGYSAGVIHKTSGGSASEQNPYLIAGAIAGAFAGLATSYIVVWRLRPFGRDAAEFDDYEDS